MLYIIDLAVILFVISCLHIKFDRVDERMSFSIKFVLGRLTFTILEITSKK